MNNLILASDVYKSSDWMLYPPNTEKVYSYLEAKAHGRLLEVVFFGLQYYLKEYLAGNVITKEKIDEAERIFNKSFQNDNLFNRQNWEYIVEKHDGKLPIEIKALPEGTVVNRGNVLLTIENTDPQCYWLVNFLESLLLKLWYTSTVASHIRNIKMSLLNYFNRTGTDQSLIDFKLHDFGLRDCSSIESAQLSGCAHLLSFKSTSNTPALIFAEKYYDYDEPGYSIPVADHNAIISWGLERENAAFENALHKFPNGFLSLAGDSYNPDNVLKNSLRQLKDKIVKRDGILLIRPYQDNPPGLLTYLEALARNFGFEVNDRSRKFAKGNVQIIQEISNEMILDQILTILERNRWTLNNVIFTTGDYQDFTRETCKFTFKSSAIFTDGQNKPVYKRPHRASAKSSRGGKLKVIFKDNFRTVSINDPNEDELKQVFLNGEIKETTTLEEARYRAFVD